MAEHAHSSSHAVRKNARQACWGMGRCILVSATTARLAIGTESPMQQIVVQPRHGREARALMAWESFCGALCWEVHRAPEPAVVRGRRAVPHQAIIKAESASIGHAIIRPSRIPAACPAEHAPCLSAICWPPEYAPAPRPASPRQTARCVYCPSTFSMALRP